MSQQTLILVAAALLIALVLYVFLKPKRKKAPTIIETYTPSGQIWVKKMCELFDSGETWSKDPELLFEKTFNVTLPRNEHGHKISAYWQAIGYNIDFLNAPENSAKYRSGDFFEQIDRALSMRFAYQYKPLTAEGEAEVMKKYGLNIGSDEFLYHYPITIDWYEERTVRTNLSYSGLGFRSGGRMNYRTGSLSVVADQIKDFVPVDRGDLFITNKRIIFVGKENRQNRAVGFDELLELSLYKDGILLGKSNGRKPLVVDPGVVNALVPRDELNQILRVLERVMSNTQDQDLTPADFKSVT